MIGLLVGIEKRDIIYGEWAMGFRVFHKDEIGTGMDRMVTWNTRKTGKWVGMVYVIRAVKQAGLAHLSPTRLGL